MREIAGIGVVKRFAVAPCGVKYLNLATECIKILRVYISYNKKSQDEKNFCDTFIKIGNKIDYYIDFSDNQMNYVTKTTSLIETVN